MDDGINNEGDDALLAKENVRTKAVTKSAITGLNHLAKWPPVNITFQNIKYEVFDFEGKFYFLN